MTKTYQIYQVNSFTKDMFRGNPAGVVINAKGLTSEQMQDIARELNNSETAFLFPPDGPDHDVRVRFFTPTIEVPSCGHATIAAHYVRATKEELPDSILLQKIGIGILPVEIMKEENDYHIIMTQGKIDFLDEIVDNNREILLSALDLESEELDERCPIQIVSTGHSKVMIGIKDREKLNSIVPDLNKLKTLSKEISCKGYYLFTFDSDDSNILTQGRMFAPAIGINEDPVTGNASGPLGAYLVRYHLAEHNGRILEFNAGQGQAIKRDGLVQVTIEIQDGQPVKAKVGGNAVIVFETQIEI